MKLKLRCFRCAFQSDKIYYETDAVKQLSEDDLYHFTCQKGHENLLELQAFKFELLFESGLCAIKDGYFLESVLSITASLERFYEFFLKVVIGSKEIPEDLYEQTFSLMSKQSERQFGAFILFYLTTFKETPILVKSKFTEFRNNVVHKGYIPKEEETLNYAEEIYTVIRAILSKLIDEFDTKITELQFEIKRKRREKWKDLIKEVNMPITQSSPSLVLSHALSREALEKQTFQEGFEQIKRNPMYN